MSCLKYFIRKLRILDNILGSGKLIRNRNEEKNSQHDRKIEMEKTW